MIKRKPNDQVSLRERNTPHELKNKALKYGQSNKGGDERNTISREDHESMLKMIANLREQVARTSSGGSTRVVEMVKAANEVLDPHLLQEVYLIGWSRPKLPTYDGNANPKDHLHSFIIGMEEYVIAQYEVWHHICFKGCLGKT